MPRRRYVILLALLCYPLAEWWVASRAADIVGWDGVIVAFAIGAIAGIVLIRRTAGRLAGRLSSGQDPGKMTGPRMAAGVLLTVPGFLTDVIALMLLVPAVGRLASRRVVAWLGAGRGIGLQSWSYGQAWGPGGEMIPGGVPGGTGDVIAGEVVRDEDGRGGR